MLSPSVLHRFACSRPKRCRERRKDGTLFVDTENEFGEARDVHRQSGGWGVGDGRQSTITRSTRESKLGNAQGTHDASMHKKSMGGATWKTPGANAPGIPHKIYESHRRKAQIHWEYTMQVNSAFRAG